MIIDHYNKRDRRKSKQQQILFHFPPIPRWLTEITLLYELSLHKYVFLYSLIDFQNQISTRYGSIKFSRYMHIVYIAKTSSFHPYTLTHSLFAYIHTFVSNIDRIEWIQSLTFQWERFFAPLKLNKCFCCCSKLTLQSHSHFHLLESSSGRIDWELNCLEPFFSLMQCAFWKRMQALVL